MSKQKDLIFSIVMGTMSHPTADWIYQQARRKMSRISLGTVYRNLKSLSDEGRLLEITNTKGPSRYDANTSRHSHLRCLGCGKMEDVPEKEIEFVARSRKIRQFRISRIRAEFIGYCSDCKTIPTENLTSHSSRRKTHGPQRF
jgi:Fur family transcriptional regulator, peroxide stress response regulator